MTRKGDIINISLIEFKKLKKSGVIIRSEPELIIRTDMSIAMCQWFEAERFQDKIIFGELKLSILPWNKKTV